MKWYIPENNVIFQTGESEILPENAISVSDDTDILSLLTKMEDGEGGFIDRPQSPEITQITSSSFSILQCPVNTLITVVDVTGSEIMGEITVSATMDQNIEFQDPGTYQIIVEPPLPALDRILQVEVQ